MRPLEFDVPDDSEAGELIRAYSVENGCPASFTASILLQARLEDRPHGLREPGSLERRKAEIKMRREAEAKEARAKREADAKAEKAEKERREAEAKAEEEQREADAKAEEGSKAEEEGQPPEWGPLRFDGSCKGCKAALKKGDRGLAKSGLGALGVCCEAKAADFLAGTLQAA